MYGALIELYHTEPPELLSRPNKKHRKDCEMWGAICATPNSHLNSSVTSSSCPLKKKNGNDNFAFESTWTLPRSSIIVSCSFLK
jgi:hypothetical protein